MAARIDKNDPADFAGAMLLVPPEGGEPIELLLVNPARNLAMFWSTVSAMVQVAAREFEERARSNDPFRR
jgi:hypothetical protein